MEMSQSTNFRHDLCHPIDPPGMRNRRWQCEVCGLKGTIQKLKDFSCKRRLTKKEGEEALLKELA